MPNPIPANALGADQGSVFFQLTPDVAPVYVGCIDMGDIPSPSGAQTQFYCRNRDGVLQSIGTTQGIPDLGTTTITVPMFPTSDTIDEIRKIQRRTNCGMTVFVMTDSCGKLGVFENYDAGIVLHDVRITNFNRQNTAMREAADKILRVLDLSYQGVYDLRVLTVTQQSIAETRNLNDIVFDLDARCAGNCGAAKDPNDIGYTVGSGTAGSPTSDADVWSTDDEGATWANATGAVPSPFAGGDIKSAVLFQMDRNTWRLIVASGAKAGSAQIAYSDDGGATWTTVTVGATAWEGAAGADALFAFDRDHIWFASDHGRVYFSDDAGVTWTSQTSALTASAANALNAVKFSDYSNGFASGDNDTLIKTVDGGDNWSAVTTAPTTSDNITALAVKSKNELLVGSNVGELYQSVDAGVTWSSKAYSGQAATDTVQGIDFVNDKCGFMITNTNAPVGSVHFTVNGGVTWQKLTTPANAGLNAVFAIDENLAYVCGNAYGGTGFVAKVST